MGSDINPSSISLRDLADEDVLEAAELLIALSRGSNERRYARSYDNNPSSIEEVYTSESLHDQTPLLKDEEQDLGNVIITSPTEISPVETPIKQKWKDIRSSDSVSDEKPLFWDSEEVDSPKNDLASDLPGLEDPGLVTAVKNSNFPPPARKLREKIIREEHSLTSEAWDFTAVGTSKCQRCSHRANKGSFCCTDCGFRICTECVAKPNGPEHSCVDPFSKPASTNMTRDSSSTAKESVFRTEGWVSTARKQPPKPPKKPRKKSAKQLAKEVVAKSQSEFTSIMATAKLAEEAFHFTPGFHSINEQQYSSFQGVMPNEQLLNPAFHYPSNEDYHTSVVGLNAQIYVTKDQLELKTGEEQEVDLEESDLGAKRISSNTPPPAKRPRFDPTSNAS